MVTQRDEGTRTMLTRRVVASLVLAGPWAARAFAQGRYPDQPVKLIIPFPAGGPTDIVGRHVARIFEERLKAPFVVDNRGGAGGTIGLGALAHAKPDGYTLAISASGGLAMLPHLMPKMPFDSERDFEPVTLVMTVPQVMAVRKNLGVKDLSDLIARAKERPGKMTYGSSGFGTSLQFSAELFKLRAGNLNILHVPYRGVAPALTDLMGGQIDILFGDIPVMLPQIKAGTIVPLAVTSEKRVTALPEVPTMEESGVKGAEAETFYVLLAPAGLPAERLKLLQSTLVNALAEPDVRKILADQGGNVVGNSPEECRAFLAAEYKKWGEVARLANIQMQ